MTMRQLALEVLGEAEIRRINFRYRSCPVYSSGYADIARMIEKGRITVGRLRGSGGIYYEEDDSMFIARGRDKSVRRTIVHEATHALQDRHGDPMPSLASEGAAYVAGGFYSVLKERATGDGDWTAPPEPRQPGNGLANLARSPDPHLVETYQISYRIARRIIDESAGYLVSDAEADLIEAELSQTREYASDVGRTTVFNGIRPGSGRKAL